MGFAISVSGSRRLKAWLASPVSYFRDFDARAALGAGLLLSMAARNEEGADHDGPGIASC
jgi:hypothetical protein